MGRPGCGSPPQPGRLLDGEPGGIGPHFTVCSHTERPSCPRDRHCNPSKPARARRNQAGRARRSRLSVRGAQLPRRDPLDHAHVAEPVHVVSADVEGQGAWIQILPSRHELAGQRPDHHPDDQASRSFDRRSTVIDNLPSRPDRCRSIPCPTRASTVVAAHRATVFKRTS